MFEIAEGGFLDIDVKIVGPDGRVIYQGERETSGKYTFAAHVPGVYTYCFSNQMSTMTPKVVLFNMDVGEAPKETPEDTEAHHNKLDDMIRELSSTLTGVKHEQEYMQVKITRAPPLQKIAWGLSSPIIHEHDLCPLARQILVKIEVMQTNL